jgi:hypothetical protein
MTEPEPTPERPTAPERRTALLRVALGHAQMLTAAVGLVLLLSFGPEWPTLVAVGVAGLLLLTSKLLFRGT